MNKGDAVLGMPVRFRKPMIHKYIPRTGLANPRKEWHPVFGWADDHWVDGVLIGVRTLSDGDYDYGGGEEQAALYNRTYFTAFLVVRDLRSNPQRVRPEDVEPLYPPVTPVNWDGGGLIAP